MYYENGQLQGVNKYKRPPRRKDFVKIKYYSNGVIESRKKGGERYDKRAGRKRRWSKAKYYDESGKLKDVVFQ